MDGRCTDCTWWDPKDYQPGWGYCAMTSSRFTDAEHPESLAVAQDNEGDGASLKTHETFGCIQFKATP